MQESQSITLRTRGDLVTPQKGYVVINGRKHLVSFAPQPTQQQAITQQPEPTAQYVVTRERPSQNNPSIHLQITPLNIALALIATALFCVGASMFSIALTSYSNSQGRIDRLQRLIYVEP